MQAPSFFSCSPIPSPKMTFVHVSEDPVLSFAFSEKRRERERKIMLFAVQRSERLSLFPGPFSLPVLLKVKADADPEKVALMVKREDAKILSLPRWLCRSPPFFGQHSSE